MNTSKFIAKVIFFFVRARAYSESFALVLLVSLSSTVNAASASTLSDLKQGDLKTKYATLDAMKGDMSLSAAQALTAAANSERDIRFTLALLDQIAQTHQDAVVPDVAPLLRHANAKVRRGAAEVIGLLGGRKAEAPLVAALRRERDPEVISALVNSLSVTGGQASVEVVREQLKSDRPHIRENAKHTLKRISKEAK